MWREAEGAAVIGHWKRKLGHGRRGDARKRADNLICARSVAYVQYRNAQRPIKPDGGP